MLNPRSVRDVQAFLGLASFYRRFIHRFSAIAAPLIKLLVMRKVKSSATAMLKPRREVEDPQKLMTRTQLQS